MRITQKIFLGSALDGNNRKLLHKEGITHVLIVAKEVPTFHDNDFIYKKIELDENCSGEIQQDLDLIADFISFGSLNGSILVHCLMGNNRSVAAIISYLIKYQGLGFSKALGTIKAKKKDAFVSDGLKLQLKLFRASNKTHPQTPCNKSEKLKNYEFRSFHKVEGSNSFVNRVGNGQGVIRSEIQSMLNKISKMNRPSMIAKKKKKDIDKVPRTNRGVERSNKRPLKEARSLKKNSSLDQLKKSEDNGKLLLQLGNEFIHNTYSTYLKSYRHKPYSSKKVLEDNMPTTLASKSHRSTDSGNIDNFLKMPSSLKKMGSRYADCSMSLVSPVMSPFKSSKIKRLDTVEIESTLKEIASLSSYIQRTDNENTKYKHHFFKSRTKYVEQNSSKQPKRGLHIYKCKKCLHCLFTHDKIKFHQSDKLEKLLCKSYFVEKLEWLEHDGMNALFKIKCPRCRKIIGEGKIVGIMCSCGNIQSPAIKIFKDCVKKVVIQSGKK